MSTQSSFYDPGTYQRVTRRQPCFICGKTDWCTLRSDGAIHCMRIESDRPAKDGAGWWHNLPSAQPATSQSASTHKDTYTDRGTSRTEPTYRRGNGELVDGVYRCLLEACPLTDAARAQLRHGGIDGTDLQGLGSLPATRGSVRHHLLTHYTQDQLCSVPGFAVGPSGILHINAPAGLLVAVQDASGYIVGMQCRIVDKDGKKKYLWLSSADSNGPGSGTPAHVAAGTTHHVVWITEGLKKATVAAAMLHTDAIGLPGHATIDDGLRQLDQLIDAGALAVVIALDQDADPATAALVEQSRRRLVAECLGRGLAVRIARWDPGVAKGIDDLLLAGGQPQIEKVYSNTAIDDPGQRVPGRRLTKEEEAARYRCIRKILWNSDYAHRAASMTPAEKLTLLCSYEMADIYPGTVMAGGSTEATPLNMGALAARVGCSPRIAGDNIRQLASHGLIERKEQYMPDNGHKQILVAAGRPLAYNEVLDPSPRREADKHRKRCCSCGSERLTIRSVCLECGTVEVIQHGDDQDISLEKDPTADSAVGVNIDEIPWDEPSSIDLPADSAVGPILQETLAAPVTRSPDREVCVDPWQCPCGSREWQSHSGQEGTYCVACGNRYRQPATWPRPVPLRSTPAATTPGPRRSHAPLAHMATRRASFGQTI